MSFDLSKNLNSKDSFAERDGIVDSLTFDSSNDRGAIVSTRIKNLTFDQISGGTAILGGTNNQSGMLVIRDQTGTITLGSFSKDGFKFKDATDSVQVVLPTDDTPVISSLILGGTRISPTAEGGLTIKAGTSTISVFTVDGYVINKKLRLGGTDSTFGGDAGISNELELYGTITANPVGTPGINACRIYVDNGGAGSKNRIMAQFDSGTPVLIVTEP